MGVDLNIRIVARHALTPEECKELEFQLRHRFRNLMWPAHSDFEWAHIKAATQYKEGEDEEEEVGGNTYEIPVWCRWYGEGYERGPALGIYGLCRFLASRSEVMTVLIGNDHSGEYEEATGAYLERMFSHFMAVGNLPYSMDTEKDGPMCCGHQMVRYGWGGNYAAWACQGCGDRVERRGEETKRFREDGKEA